MIIIICKKKNDHKTGGFVLEYTDSYYDINLYLYMQIHRIEASTDKEWLLSLGARYLDLTYQFFALPISNQPAPLHIFSSSTHSDSWGCGWFNWQHFRRMNWQQTFCGCFIFYSAPLGSGENPAALDRGPHHDIRDVFFFQIGKWFETETETCGFPGRGDYLQRMFCFLCLNC